MKKSFIHFLFILFSFPLFSQIEVKNLQQHVYALADDSMQGRNTATAGGRMAASYIVQQYQAIGLSPKGTNNSFLQSFTYYAGK